MKILVIDVTKSKMVSKPPLEGITLGKGWSFFVKVQNSLHSTIYPLIIKGNILNGFLSSQSMNLSSDLFMLGWLPKNKK